MPDPSAGRCTNPEMPKRTHELKARSFKKKKKLEAQVFTQRLAIDKKLEIKNPCPKESCQNNGATKPCAREHTTANGSSKKNPLFLKGKILVQDSSNASIEHSISKIDENNHGLIDGMMVDFANVGVSGSSSSSALLSSMEAVPLEAESTTFGVLAPLVKMLFQDPCAMIEYSLGLPQDVWDRILGLLDLTMHEIVHLLLVSKDWKGVVHRASFYNYRPVSEGQFSPIIFTTDNASDWHWHGFDMASRKWMTLPSLNFARDGVLPHPDPDLFKDYLVVGHRGLLCINTGKAPNFEQIVICNPLTREAKVLPPLNHRRQPVLMHLRVEDDGHYKVIVVGSAVIGTEELSVKTEEYDSKTGTWESPEDSDLPCSPFGLNEYQNGVYYKDDYYNIELLLCVAILDTRGKGVLVYDITKKKWLKDLVPRNKNRHIPLVRDGQSGMIPHLATTQIVECGGSVFVFSEQEHGKDVYFCIDKLYICRDINTGAIITSWELVIRYKKTSGGRGLLVYPEYTCVPTGNHELTIFNTIEHTMDTIDLTKAQEVTLLRNEAHSIQEGIQQRNKFFSLNPIVFVYQPSFRSRVCPIGGCDVKLAESQYCSECVKKDLESCGPAPSTNQVGGQVSFGKVALDEKHELENDSPIIPESEFERLEIKAKPKDVGIPIETKTESKLEPGSECQCPLQQSHCMSDGKKMHSHQMHKKLMRFKGLENKKKRTQSVGSCGVCIGENQTDHKFHDQGNSLRPWNNSTVAK